jgi:hypothetical protein
MPRAAEAPSYPASITAAQIRRALQLCRDRNSVHDLYLTAGQKGGQPDFANVYLNARGNRTPGTDGVFNLSWLAGRSPCFICGRCRKRVQVAAHPLVPDWQDAMAEPCRTGRFRDVGVWTGGWLGSCKSATGASTRAKRTVACADRPDRGPWRCFNVNGCAEICLRQATD